MSTTVDSRPSPDIEPAIAAMLDRKVARRQRAAYEIVSTTDLLGRLDNFFGREIPGSRVADLARMGGGGSKEQFRFVLEQAGERDGPYVLRMDPYEGVVETERGREFAVLRAVADVVPVPWAGWVDPAGEHFGRPSMIMEFKSGVLQPTGGKDGNITGMGLSFGGRWAELLSGRFLDVLAATHAFDWRTNPALALDAPVADPLQPARWQVHWWSRIWDDDEVASVPMVALTRGWLLDNLPACSEPVLVHGDFRCGNFLFDEDTAQITAMLDWELAHIGDPHEDLAWILTTGTLDTGLLGRDELLARYSALTGRSVDADALRFYEVFSNFKCLVMTLGTALKVAKQEYSHQDVLLTWMAMCGHTFQSKICRLLDGEDFQ